MFLGGILLCLGWWQEHLDKHPMGGYVCPIYCEVEHKHFIDHEDLSQDSLVAQSELLSYRDIQKTPTQINP